MGEETEVIYEELADLLVEARRHNRNWEKQRPGLSIFRPAEKPEDGCGLPPEADRLECRYMALLAELCRDNDEEKTA